MTLKETYDIWIGYYFPSRTNSMRYKLNICMFLLRPLHNMEMDDIDENTLQYIRTWYRNDIHFPLCIILIICLKRWNDGYGIPHTSPDFHFYGRSYIPPYKEIPMEPLNECSTFDQLYAHYRKLNFPRMSIAQQRDYDLCWKKMEQIRKIQFRHLREKDLEPCKKQSSPYTIIVMYRLLYQMSRYACSIDILDRIHFHPVKRETGNRKTDVNVLKDHEIDILFSKTEYESVCMLLFILYTGMQLKELFALRKDWIDIDNQLLHITHPVSGKKRILPIHHRIMPIAERWKHKLPVLCTCDLGYYQKCIYLRELAHLISIAWLDHEMMASDCRYTFMSRLENTDANTVHICMLAGKRPPGTGGRSYTHPSIEQLRNTIEQLN